MLPQPADGSSPGRSSAGARGGPGPRTSGTKLVRWVVVALKASPGYSSGDVWLVATAETSSVQLPMLTPNLMTQQRNAAAACHAPACRPPDMPRAPCHP